MAGLGVWGIENGSAPGRLADNPVLLESKLEEWIETDPSILDSTVRWVSRQLVLPDRSRLDLLGLARDGTWVIAELKAGPPTADAVRQAVHYFMEMAGMSNADLVARIRSQGVSDAAVEEQLAEMLNFDEEQERDYRILIAGVGDGSAAEAAAATLARYGLAVPIEVVRFHLFGTATGHVLVREVADEAVDSQAEASRWTFDAILERADRFGVADAFMNIRAELLLRGYKSRLKKNGLNFNYGSRRQLFWLEPRRDGIHIGYCDWNFPHLYGIARLDAQARLGANWVTVPPDDALKLMSDWLVQVDQWREMSEAPGGAP